MTIPKEHERLMELIGLVRDGGLSDEQQMELESLLDQDPEALAYYVESVDVITMLRRQQGMVAGDGQASQVQPILLAPTPPASSGWSSAVGWCLAVFASLAIGILVGRLVLPLNNDSITEPVAANLASVVDAPEIGTLTSAAGCIWESQGDLPYEGQRLTAQSLRLADGVAVVQFDCDVRLVLEGPAHLDLVSVNRAKLNFGKAVFTGEGDLDRFTLATPFSEIHDEGTEYAVSVDTSGTVGEIHVFDGRVNCDPVAGTRVDASEPTLRLDAGEARRFNGSRQVETIAADASRFVRKPLALSTPADSIATTELFAYEAEALAGLEGGSGWLGAWTQPSGFDSKQGAFLLSDESLNWPVHQPNPSDGSLIIAGDTGLHRTLQEPIRMDRDAAYYLSFVVRKHSPVESTSPNGWAYLTLRDPRKQEEKIAISLASTRGTPRMVHKGRAANATNQLSNEIVYLFVCKILARQNKEDQISVRIYSDHETVDFVEPSAWSITTRPVDDDSVFSELRLYSRNCDPIQLDNIRIGRTWSSVASEYFQ